MLIKFGELSAQRIDQGDPLSEQNARDVVLAPRPLARRRAASKSMSRRIGTMELTTLDAVASIEKSDLVCRVQDENDRRKQLILF
ncbi:hypothetical protein [Afipia sp. GAS231]|uniref:hypothetical protein n=1 Tax=Afipia sp. GAS231 TaxID=1882747 RepID=UPI000B863D4F|nr:hypothetical protein [Afipia sp. GAS231]